MAAEVGINPATTAIMAVNPASIKDRIRDLALEYLEIYGFDKDYELTESGKLAEELVDKLYI